MRRRLLALLVLAAALSGALAAVPGTAHAAGGGAGFFGSRGGQPLNAPIVGMAATPSGKGYWLVASDGGIFNYGDAGFFGSRGGQRLNAPIVGMAATPSGRGYWLVASDGGIFNYGDAGFHGSAGGLSLNRPVVAMAATPSGGGYWLAASDGGVFNYGDAGFFGSAGGTKLNRPVVGMAARPAGDGYWLVASDGGVFNYGQAGFHGSAGGLRLNRPVVGMAPLPTGNGYWLVASDGGVFGYDAPFFGSTGSRTLNAPIVGMAATPSGGGYWMVAGDGGIFAFPDSAPSLSVATLVAGLDIPWDLDFTPDGTLLFDERNSGRISAMVGGARRTLATVGDVYANSESGMLGLAVDPAFGSNRRIFVCQSFRTGSSPVDVRVYQWTVAADYSSATRGTAIVTGIPTNAGRHNGCRLRFGADGFLWIGTGDAAVGANPQNLNSLGGKVLRVDRNTGAAAPGNPFGTRVYEYGHRNIQGLAVRPGSGQMFSVEHGPDRDDELNLLRSGANSGWDPVPGYNEGVPMTDTAKFPGASRAVWSSGAPTLATSGATFLSGGQWKSYSGALAVACLKASQLRLFFLDAAGAVAGVEAPMLTGFGRLRSPVQGPDGRLYVTTSNGGGADKILVVTPT
jgi:glucose/arabinose dehydrogenase